jgi:hypothetical protein
LPSTGAPSVREAREKQHLTTQLVKGEHLFYDSDMEAPCKHWPELVPRYEKAYQARAYLPPAFAERTTKAVARLREVHGVSDRRLVVLNPPPEPEQLSLLAWDH